ncbi:MAG TPA: NAD(P)H-quinone oxidoreductase [Lentisphaeria bacterium]|nr:NAD(P)H-quinone oxidoreductase [Lentisphaeria bacterium]
MYAMLIDVNKNFVWQEVAEPVRGAGDVLIEVAAAGLNRADLLQRSGNYPSPPGWPEWPGLEASGRVLEAPAGSRWRPGDKVCALLGGGGYAERVSVPAGMVMSVPAGLDLTAAAGLPEVFATAYLNLVVEAGMKAGDVVFIQAGASGVGLAAIQLAKQTGCKVITTVGSPEKAAFVKTIGADIVVNRKTEDLGAVLEANPIDIALDCAGGPALGEYIAKMAFRGRWVLIATLGGNRAELPLDTLYKKRIRIIGSTLRSRTDEEKAAVLQALEKDYWPKIAAGKIKNVIYRVLPITEATAAHAILERNENTGKVILKVKD